MYCLLKIENNQMHPSEISKECYDVLMDGYGKSGEVLNISKELNQFKTALIDLERWCRTVDTNPSRLLENQEIAERKCQSVLTAFKNYLEHLKVYIRNKYSDSSQFFNLYNNARANARNTSDEFTFIYELRNYSQHQDKIVHCFLSTESFLQPASNPQILLSQYGCWNQRERAFISSHPAGIDLQKAFEKAYDAIGLIYQPVIQYLLDNSDAGSNLGMLRSWMDKYIPRDAAQLYSLATIERKDGTQATMKDYMESVPGLEFKAVAVDWNLIYEVTDALTVRG